MVRRRGIPGTLDPVRSLLRLNVASFATNNIGGMSMHTVVALGLYWLGVWMVVYRGITAMVNLFLVEMRARSEIRHATLDNPRHARISAQLDRVGLFGFAIQHHRRYVQLPSLLERWWLCRSVDAGGVGYQPRQHTPVISRWRTSW